MISLACTSCKQVLQIDEAFAGGVCRCQHCGTIQTVPASLKRGVRSVAPTPGIAKTLYQKKPRPPGEANRSGSGLEALAEGVGASSGLARSALRSRAAVPTAPPPPRPRRLLLLLIGAGVVIALLLVIIAIMALHSG